MKRLALASATLLLLAACSDSNPPSEQAASHKAAAIASDLLVQVPADTPYLYVSSQPLPEGLADRFLESANQELIQARQDLQARATGQAGLPAPARVMLALFDELEGKLSREGLASLGIPVEGYSLIYGLGPLPVLRREISDQGKVEALLQRIEQKSGVSAPRGQFQGHEYRRFSDNKKWVLILATTPKELLAALLPLSQEQQLLPLLLGQQRPQTSLADTHDYQQFLTDNRFRGYGDGYLDLRGLSTIMLGAAQGVNGRVWQALDTPASHTSPQCKQLTERLVADTPRWVMGLTRVSDNAFTLHSLLETSPEVGAHLQKLTASTPGHTAAQPAMFSLGLALSLPAARDGIKQALRYLLDQGKGCAWVKQREITTAMLSMDMLLNPMVAGIKGVEVRLNDLELDPASLQPKGVDAQLLLSVDDPKGMIAMASMLNPSLARLQVPADGSPVALDLQGVAPGAPRAYVAIKDKLLVLASGEHASQGIERLLAAPGGSNPPLLHLSYDLQKLGERARPLLEKRIESMKRKGGTQLANAQQALNALNAATRGYQRVDWTLRGDARGLVMDMDAQLK